MSIVVVNDTSSNRHRSGKLFCILTVLFISLCPIHDHPNAKEPSAEISQPLHATQGEVLRIVLPSSVHNPETATGTFLKRTIPLFRDPSQQFTALVGIDMQDPPGRHEFLVHVQTATGPTSVRYMIVVNKEDYPVQRLTLPNNKVNLDQNTLVRVKAERKALLASFDQLGPRPLWETPFIEPVSGRISGRFGSRRIINGTPKSPHSGEDIAAPKGTPVSAMNTGTVRLTHDHFFTGKGVILDHGVGLYSMYFHLSKITVKEGQLVKKGETIGQVGATGRATGPHLHWGVRLNGARVNPYALINLSKAP